MRKHHIAVYLSFTSMILYRPIMNAEQIITFFIKPLKEAPVQKLAKAPIKPSRVPKAQLFTYLPPVNQGIFASYAGYVTPSDKNGQITFLRKHLKPAVNVLVTPKIKPIWLNKTIISHWEIPNDVQAQQYYLERRKSNIEPFYAWHSKIVPLPEDRKISLNTIIIFAKPKNIIVPTGVIPAFNTQLILPNIYARKGLAKTRETLYLLSINSFFEPITKISQRIPYGYAQLIANQ